MAEIRLSGIGVSEGIRMGKAFLYANEAHSVQFHDIGGDSVEKELERFRAAKTKCIEEMDALIEQAEKSVGEEKAVVLKGQRSFLVDPAFCPQMEKLISNKLYSAEKAADQIVKQFVGIFEKMPNEYMRERAADVKDVGKRILSALTGKASIRLADIREEVILIAEDLAPSDTVQLDKKYILAFATKIGGKTSHTAIFSRSLGIPAVIGIGDPLDVVQNNDLLIFDGSEGLCIVNPEAETIKQYEKKMELERQQQESLKDYASRYAVTKDGFRVEIAANIGTTSDASFADEQGAEGVGLFRTELLYMSEGKLPDEETQFKAYKDVLETMGTRTVIIRTLDIGGDKELPYMKIPKEMNPFLGYRAIRLCLDRKELFVTQLRAILRASVFGKAKIMFPMISSLEEWRSAKNIFKEVQKQLQEEGIPFDPEIQLGMMVEVPSAAMLAEQFAKEVDFFSIGTNDLVQYTLAVDRMNEKVAYLYDHFHPAIISLIKRVVDAAHTEGKYAGMCGGMAGDPLAVPLLLALGLDELSMSATSIQKVKFTVTQCELAKCKELLNEVIKLDTVKEIRSVLERFNGHLTH